MIAPELMGDVIIPHIRQHMGQYRFRPMPLKASPPGARMVRLTLGLKEPLSGLILLFFDFFNMFRFRRCPAPWAVVGCSRALRPQAAVKRHEDLP